MTNIAAPSSSSSSKNVFALVDCNNFYVSCERVFNPKLINKPVVVLSNNDGCIIARSNEAKRLGIKMGSPLFKAQGLIDFYDVKVFSSNYALYGDMSSRVMEALSTFTPETEIYSIDEAFLNLSLTNLSLLKADSYSEAGKQIKRSIKQWTGIPVSIGIARTKVLAKLANRLAKSSEEPSGVLDLSHPTHLDVALERTPIEDVWGIGRSYAKLLKAHGILTARQFRDADRRWVRQMMTVVGARLHAELNGISCLPLDVCPPPKKSITVSRSFGRTIENLSDLKEAVATFITRAGEKLRQHKQAAKVVTVFIQTSRFNQGTEQYANTATRELLYPTDATKELLECALSSLERIFKLGYKYKKAGVMLNDFINRDDLTLRMFGQVSWEKRRRVSLAMDEINRQYGRETVSFGAAKREGKWQMKQLKRSALYTTRFNELLAIDVDRMS